MGSDSGQPESALTEYHRLRRQAAYSAVPCLAVLILLGALFVRIADNHHTGVPGHLLSVIVGKRHPYYRLVTAYINPMAETPTAQASPGAEFAEAFLHLVCGRRNHGLWAATSKVGPELRWAPPPDESQDAWTMPPDRVLAAFREYVRTNEQLYVLSNLDAAIAAGGIVRKTRWAGHMENAVTLALVAAAAWTARRLTHRLELVRVASCRLCSRCHYDLTGLAPTTTTCPECGTPLDLAQQFYLQSSAPQPAERAKES